MSESLIQSKAKVIKCKVDYKYDKNQITFKDRAISTNLLPQTIDVSIGTISNSTKPTQTELARSFAKEYDEELLAKCLQRMELIIEKEVNKSYMPTVASYWKFYSISKGKETISDRPYVDRQYDGDDWKDNMSDNRFNITMAPNIQIHQQIQLSKGNDHIFENNDPDNNNDELVSSIDEEEYRGLAT